MSYTPNINKLKMAIYTARLYASYNNTNGDNISDGYSSTSWGKIHLTGLIEHLNPFDNSVTLNTSTDVLTLPAGEYFLDARISTAQWRINAGAWGWYADNSRTQWSKCSFYNYLTSTAFGFEGKQFNEDEANNTPDQPEHAKAYISSDSEMQIQLRAKTSHSDIDVAVSQTKMSQPRVLIYRLA